MQSGFFFASDQRVYGEKQDQVNPEIIKEMPVANQQFEFQPLLRVGKIHEHRHRVYHFFFGGFVKIPQKRHPRDHVRQVYKRYKIQISSGSGGV